MTQIARKRGRPKSNPAQSEDTKEALLQAGLVWLTQNGFSSSSLDAILKSVSVPKGSFYHYFASKEVFGLAVLARYRQYFEYKLDKHLLATSLDPLTRLQAFMDDACSGIEKYQYQRGCLIGNLEQEVHALPESFRHAIVDTYNSWQQRIAQCLEEAKAQHQIASDADSRRLAEIFWIGWEGAVSRARLQHSLAPLRLFGQYYLEKLPS